MKSYKGKIPNFILPIGHDKSLKQRISSIRKRIQFYYLEDTEKPDKLGKTERLTEKLSKINKLDKIDKSELQDKVQRLNKPLDHPQFSLKQHFSKRGLTNKIYSDKNLKYDNFSNAINSTQIKDNINNKEYIRNNNYLHTSNRKQKLIIRPKDSYMINENIDLDKEDNNNFKKNFMRISKKN